MFYGGKLKTMPPKLVSDDGRHVVIRPLAYCKEKDLAAYAEIEDFPIIPCNLCGSQKNLQRQAVKEMLQQWDKKFPGRLETMFTALQNIQPSHLADPALYDFQGSRLEAGLLWMATRLSTRKYSRLAVEEMLSLSIESNEYIDISLDPTKKRPGPINAKVLQDYFTPHQFHCFAGSGVARLLRSAIHQQQKRLAYVGATTS